MKRIATAIPDVAIIETQVFSDQRGWFTKTWNDRLFVGMGIYERFVQDNLSFSTHGVLRGLHYQMNHAQGKLVQCLEGRIYDVAVDIRRSSPTFGQYVAVELSADNHRMLWMPKGFAHGFLVLSDTAKVFYKVTDIWDPESERGLRWNDPALGIEWPSVGIAPILNERDAAYPCLSETPNTNLF